jgi:hypothetical protein
MLNTVDHSYTGILSGEHRQSVTNILEEEGLITGKQFYRGNAAERGQAVHNLLNIYNKGQKILHVPDSIRYGLTLWQRFLKHTGARVIASECEVEHPLFKYAGQLDCLLRVDGDVWLLDYKNTSGGYQPWWEFQTELYRAALAFHPQYSGLVVARRMGLILRPDLEYPKFIPHNRIGGIAQKAAALVISNAAKHEAGAISEKQAAEDSLIWG